MMHWNDLMCILGLSIFSKSPLLFLAHHAALSMAKTRNAAAFLSTRGSIFWCKDLLGPIYGRIWLDEVFWNVWVLTMFVSSEYFQRKTVLRRCLVAFGSLFLVEVSKKRPVGYVITKSRATTPHPAASVHSIITVQQVLLKQLLAHGPI